MGTRGRVGAVTEVVQPMPCCLSVQLFLRQGGAGCLPQASIRHVPALLPLEEQKAFLGRVGTKLEPGSRTSCWVIQTRPAVSRYHLCPLGADLSRERRGSVL